jgi:hypothetical protein
MRRLPFRPAALLVLVCIALTPAMASAADDKTGSEKGKVLSFKNVRIVNAPAPEARSAVLDALRGFEADKKAGKFGTVAEEKRIRREVLKRAFERNRSDEGLKPRATAAGATAVDVDGRYEYVMLSRVNADGSVSTTCVTDWRAAEAFLDGTSSSGRATE